MKRTFYISNLAMELLLIREILGWSVFLYQWTTIDFNIWQFIGRVLGTIISSLAIHVLIKYNTLVKKRMAGLD